MKRHIFFLISVMFLLNQPLYSLYGMECIHNLLCSIFQPQQETVVLAAEQPEVVREELAAEVEVEVSLAPVHEDTCNETDNCEVDEQGGVATAQEVGVDILDDLDKQMSVGDTPTGSRGFKDISVTIGKAAGVFATVFVGYLLVYATNVSVRNKTNKTLRSMRDALKRAVKRENKQKPPVEKTAVL
jgi:hypothetical protein